VGNEESVAVIEMHFPLPEIIFQHPSLISITGTGFDATLNEEKLPLWKPVIVQKNVQLKFKNKSSGGRVYLAVRGGWKADEWLGSSGTHLGVNAGGYFGRGLKKGDIVSAIRKEDLGDDARVLPWGISKNELDKVYSTNSIIRCVQGVEYSLLSDESKTRLVSSTFTISNQSDRMGFRLSGEPLIPADAMELVSSPVDFGTVQLLPDGNLIILMADHQTTGGYPRIASVVKADLPKLAQFGPNDKMDFRIISLEEAERLLLSRENLLEELKASCHEKLNKYLAK
jgi:antagonist of KipI